MVRPEDILTTTAEIAITIAGFSGVVAAILFLFLPAQDEPGEA